MNYNKDTHTPFSRCLNKLKFSCLKLKYCAFAHQMLDIYQFKMHSTTGRIPKTLLNERNLTGDENRSLKWTGPRTNCSTDQLLHEPLDDIATHRMKNKNVTWVVQQMRSQLRPRWWQHPHCETATKPGRPAPHYSQDISSRANRPVGLHFLTTTTRARQMTACLCQSHACVCLVEKTRVGHLENSKP